MRISPSFPLFFFFTRLTTLYNIVSSLKTGLELSFFKPSEFYNYYTDWRVYVRDAAFDNSTVDIPDADWIVRDIKEVTHA